MNSFKLFVLHLGFNVVLLAHHAVVAFVDNEDDGFKKIVKEAYSNWSTDNNINWEEKQLKIVTELSSYSFVANVDLDEKYSDWEDFYILHFQKTSDYKVR